MPKTGREDIPVQSALLQTKDCFLNGGKIY
jgi:hypothetical protein